MIFTLDIDMQYFDMETQMSHFYKKIDRKFQ